MEQRLQQAAARMDDERLKAERVTAERRRQAGEV